MDFYCTVTKTLLVSLIVNFKSGSVAQTKTCIVNLNGGNLDNVNPGLINPKRLVNWGGYHLSIGL